MKDCRRTTMLFIIASLCAIAGCTSTQPINKRYASELSQLEPGLSLIEFKSLLPQAVVAGQNSVAGNRIDAYEVSHRYMYDTWYGLTRDEKLWFYFHDESLVKWGPPGAWPKPADFIIEQRVR